MWNRRNKSCLNEGTIPSNKLLEMAKFLFLEVQEISQDPTKDSLGCKTVWISPTSDMFKTNFDGANFGVSSDVGIRVVIQNSLGELRASLSDKILVIILEMLVARRVVLFTQEIIIKHSIFKETQKLLSILFARVICYLLLLVI